MGEISVITFESLYDTVRKEKTIDELQKLNPDFYKQVTDYLKTKTDAYKSAKEKNSLSPEELEKTKTQIVNARKLIKDLYERREKKSLQTALHKSRLNSADETNFLPEEKQLFDEALVVLDKFRRDILLNLVNAKMPSISSELPPVRESEPKKTVEHNAMQEEKQKNESSTSLQKENPFSTKIKIKFLVEVPEFLGPGMQVMGPFNPGDIILLYSEFADTLLNLKAAEKV